MTEGTLTTEQSASDVIAALKTQSSKYATRDALTTVTTVGEYLPYIQLMGSNSQMVKEGKFPIAHFALFKGKEPVDLGSVFIALLLSWRPKAMEYKPAVKAYYDTASDAFKRVEEAAKIPNSNKGFGAEFMMWLPEIQLVATFFMGNASGRMEAPNLIDCLENKSRICKIGNHLVTSKKNGNSWHAARMLQHDLAIDMPDLSKVMPLISKFNNPPAEEEDKEQTTQNRG